jgi:RNA polymerase sigma-B factor
MARHPKDFESLDGHPSLAAIAEMHQRYFVTRDRRLRDELVRHHSGLAYRLASRFGGRGEPMDDLVQVACIGLIHAVDRYDPMTGIAFSTYAIPTVIGELKRHFRDRAWSMRVPRRLQELYLEAKAAVGALTQELGRSPTMVELASRLGATEEGLIEALEAGRNFYALSLDAPASETAERPERIPGVIDPGLMSVDDRRFLVALAQGLSTRTRYVIELRFSRGLTQSEIAGRLGISQMHVSRLLAKAIEHMRRVAEGTLPETG